MRDIEKIIKEVNGTMTIEGMPLTEKEKEDMRSVLRGDTTFRAMREKIIAEYKPRRGNHGQI